jgi:3-hydroxyisobutyrate dehydrogenase
MVASYERRHELALGFVGLGPMGLPMCLNLLAAGYQVTVNDRRDVLASAPVARGAVWVGSPAEVAASVDVLIPMLPGPAEVESVMAGPAGSLARSLR